jgi:ribokinase
LSAKPITIMGIFVVDLAFRTNALPRWGETVLGSDFALGPGGKGSNQAVAAARLGGDVSFISKVGRDTFGEVARRTYLEAGVNFDHVLESDEHPTGAAAIILDQATGENAIVVTPGASRTLTFADIDAAEPRIAASSSFMTQLELPVPLVEYGLRLAHERKIATILNPAPACKLPESIFALCDYLTPNETEAAALTGMPVDTLQQAELAANALLARGVKNVIVTLGARGALVKNSEISEHVPAFFAGPVVETTGAGDAFNAGLAIGLSEGMKLADAVRFGCTVAGISVTRPGTAPSMPMRAEVDKALAAVR